MADNTLHSSARANWLERRFALRSRGGTLRTECLAGITGFLAAAYLLVVIPGLLAIGGMDKGAATTGTMASTSPALRKPRTATNRPMEAVNPSLIDCGTERVTTSRARSGHPLGAAVDQAGIDGLHRPVCRRPRFSQCRAGAGHGAGGGGAFIHPTDRQQPRDNHQ